MPPKRKPTKSRVAGMVEGIAAYLALGVVLLVGGWIWNKSIPHGLIEWCWAVGFVFLYPLWFGFLFKERFL